MSQQLKRLQWKFAKLNRGMVAASRTTLEAGAARIVAMQKRLAPKDSGELRDAIMWETKKGTASTRVFVNYSKSNGKPRAPHAHLVEFGTGPHVIESERPMGAGGVFGRRVEHPGTPAQPFFYPAYRSERPKLKREARNALREAAKRAVRGG
ncbi:HK97-gp10 family putative phage morphogenesis protein [Neomegalonema perideroedes]|uniref:HK97-gp10 family putative phage morphogenesis protein n=1 Tax=Neomegalonema perideroedes TaxID=217219 RepID=UPI00037D657D|nr:HK97-gp10 family putative phage morphogenesis protein [Neomegalonema perideroedes]